MNRLRVAVIGVGHLGRQHARLYDKMKGVELVAVVDTQANRARDAAREYRSKAYADHREILGMVDAASVVVPTVDHHSVAMDFIRRGIPILVEKPLAKTLSEAEDLVEQARRKETLLAVGHVERFNPVVRAVQEFIRNPRFIECHRLSSFRFRSTDIDVVLDLMIHDLDIILHWVSSDLTRIDAVGVSLLFGKEDIANARLEFEDGCVANVTASRISDKAMRKIRVFSQECYVSIDTLSKVARIYRTTPQLAETLRKMAGRGEPTLTDLAAIPREFYQIQEITMPDEEPLALELQSFLECVRQKQRPLVPGEHGVRAMAAAERIAREMRNHTWK